MYKILYVEDDISLLKTTSTFLETKQLSVIPIFDGNQAVYTFKRESPNLVLMDICLDYSPDGFELAKKIKSIRNVPIIFVTGRSDEEVFKKIKKFDNVEYLEKPFNLNALHLRIDQQIKNVNVIQIQNTPILGNTEFHLSENLIIVNGEKIQLSAKECQVMRILIDQVNQYVKTDVFLEHVWDDLALRSKIQSIYNTMSRLKKYLKSDKKLNIKNISLLGWKLTLND